jgi:holo-[acyl-carrier protein] synthase
MSTLTGIGSDIVSCVRIRRILDGKHASSFLQKILTPNEQSLINVGVSLSHSMTCSPPSDKRLVAFVAGRWAAKEAIAKLIGCGIGRMLSWQNMCIFPDAQGKPLCTITPHVWESLGIPPFHVLLTITHTEELAFAVAIGQATPPDFLHP